MSTNFYRPFVIDKTWKFYEEEKINAEERLKAAIKQWGSDAMAQLQSAADSQKAEIERWVNDYIAGLQVELPFSVKQILDRGGVVRSWTVSTEERQRGGRDFRFSYSNKDWSIAPYEFDPPSEKAVRIIVLIEPVE